MMVICADAAKVTVGSQLPKRSNVFLHEKTSKYLLGEHAPPLVAQAHAELLSNDAIHFHDNIWMTCHLADVAHTEQTSPPGSQAGSDLPAMDLVHTPNFRRHRPLSDYKPLSDEIEVLRFDLTGQVENQPKDLTLDVAATKSATANTIVQWIGFSFPDGTVFYQPSRRIFILGAAYFADFRAIHERG